MKEAVFCPNMMLELGFDESFGRVPLYIDNTSALHVAGSRTYSPRAKHFALRYFFVQELVEEGKVSIHHVNSEDQLADLRTSSTLASTVPATSPSSSTSSRLKTPTSSLSSRGGYHLPARGNLAYCS